MGSKGLVLGGPCLAPWAGAGAGGAWELAGRCVDRLQRSGPVALLESLFAPDEEEERFDWRMYQAYVTGKYYKHLELNRIKNYNTYLYTIVSQLQWDYSPTATILQDTHRNKGWFKV